jgi:hypothetical protein
MHVSILLHDLFNEVGRSSQEHVLFNEAFVDIVVNAGLCEPTFPHLSVDNWTFGEKLNGVQPQDRKKGLASATASDHDEISILFKHFPLLFGEFELEIRDFWNKIDVVSGSGVTYWRLFSELSLNILWFRL